MKSATQKDIDTALYGRRKNRTVEHSIQDACIEWINLIPGFRVWRQNTGGAKFKDKHGKQRFVKFGQTGQGDITGVGPQGVRVEIEVKRDEDATLSEKQETWQQEMQKRGAICFHCFSLEMCVVKLRQEFINRNWNWDRRWEI